jgi:hypothetical protein
MDFGEIPPKQDFSIMTTIKVFFSKDGVLSLLSMATQQRTNGRESTEELITLTKK